MRNIQIGGPSPHRVTAMFKADSAFFDLPPAATLGELADRVSHLKTRHGGALVGVNVRLAAQRSTHANRNAGVSIGGVR